MPLSVNEEALIDRILKRARELYQADREKYKNDYSGLIRGILNDFCITDHADRERILKEVCSRKGRTGGKAPRRNAGPTGTQLGLPFGKGEKAHIAWLIANDPERLLQVAHEGLMQD